MSDNSATNPAAGQTTAMKSKEKLLQLNEDLIDNCSTTSSSSGSDKLRIDIPEEAKEETNAKKTKTTDNSKIEEQKPEEKIKPAKEATPAKRQQTAAAVEVEEGEGEHNTSTNPSETSLTQRLGSKRSVDRGLDGGYWSRMSVGEMLSENKPKRTRRTVDHLDVSGMASFRFPDMDDESNSQSSLSTRKRQSTGVTKSAPEVKRPVLFGSKTWLTVRNEEGSFFLCQTINKIYENSKQCRIQWLEGENERNMYEWGQTDHIDPNSIITNVSVRKLPPGEAPSLNKSMYEIESDDLKKVNKLLSQALEEGGIMHEFASVESTDSSEPTKKADELLSDEEFFDKEDDSDTDKDAKKKKPAQKITKKTTPTKTSKKPKRVAESTSSSSASSTGSSSDEPSAAKMPTPKKKPEVDTSSSSNQSQHRPFHTTAVPSKKSLILASQQQTKKPTSFEQYKKQLLKNKLDAISSVKKSVTVSLSPADKPKNGTSVISSNNNSSTATATAIATGVTPTHSKPNPQSSFELFKAKVKRTEEASDSSSSVSKATTTTASGAPFNPFKALNKSVDASGGAKKMVKMDGKHGKDGKQVKAAQGETSGNDTDLLDSDGNEVPEGKKKKKKKNQEKSGSPKEGINMKKAAPNQENASADATIQLTNSGKKRRLFKVISNRYLDPNLKVNVYAKDPFFEEANNEASIPFVSAYVQSKLAFKALHLGDLALLRRLIADVKHVPSVHVGKSLCSKWIPAEYALYLENREALAMLIDNFVGECKDKTNQRVEMPETMFQKFFNGNYNQRSLGTPFVRKLTESRGVKEGNNAFVKDQDTLTFVTNRSKGMFFKRLFDVAYEHGTSPELFDFILAKLKNESSHSYHHDHVIEAIMFGHRKLAAHVVESAPNGYGFNAVHAQVLSADNDEDLTCKLRANMCTKKAFNNENVTPIHCACINPNVKYLKTLLSITQEYNIADKRGRKPIHYAAVCEGLSPLEYLISRVSPYELDTRGCIPLHYACLAGRCVNVEMLLSHARSKQEDDSTVTTEIIMDNKYGIGGLNKPNKRGQLPIHLAISRNNYDCVKVLIKYGCNVEYPLPNSMGKSTPLMYACQLGHQKIVQLLIENYAKIEARDRFQRTATIHAAMCGHSRTLSYLLRLGANPNAVDSSGNSVLHYACAYGWYYCVRVLLDAGAHVNVLNDWKLTPFGTAFLKGHVGLCDQLLALYPKQIDINFRTEDGETLVMLAVSSVGTFNKASVDQLEYIVTKLGGDCTLRDSRGSNALHYLAANLVNRAAIESSVDSSATNRTHLIDTQYEEQCACRNLLAEILLRSGCNPNAENSELETPFFASIAAANLSFARYLLDQVNVKVTAHQCPSGKTLLSLMAEKCIELDICQVLLSNNDQLTKNLPAFKKMARIRNEQGLTPFQIACIKLSEANDQGMETSSFKHAYKFLLFLYSDCESDPDKLMKCVTKNNKTTYSGVENQQEKPALDDDDSRETQSYNLRPISLLAKDKFADLVEALVKQMNVSEGKLARLDLTKCFDSETGMTPFLAALSNNQAALVVKLMELGVLTPAELCQHYSKKMAVGSRNESVLQLAVRHAQFAVFEACVERLVSGQVEARLLRKLLAHENAYGQNVLHLIGCRLGGSEQRRVFSGSRLNSVFARIAGYLKEQEPEMDFQMFMLELIGAKDKFGRSALHTALLNFHRHKASDIDTEMFLLDQAFNPLDQESTAEHTSLKQRLFSSGDIFGRLPLHYLFFDADHLSTNELTETDLYKRTADEVRSAACQVKLARLEAQIDPVELLTVLLKQMGGQGLDEQDLAGFTALHYAAVRGSTIACTLLISNGCSIARQCNNGNSALASAIYFERESCTLTLLRALTEKAAWKDSQEHQGLNSAYHLALDGITTHVAGSPDLKWERKVERDLYPVKSLSLYKLILAHGWEGIAWLVLGELNTYGLNQMDAVHAAIAALELDFAIRLLDKFLHESKNKSQFRADLCAHVSDAETGSSLLHQLANQSVTSAHTDSLQKLLGLLAPHLSSLLALDKRGTSPVHYACHMHNFAFIDFMCQHFDAAQTLELFTFKDSMGHSAQALLFWQIAHIDYSSQVRDRIKGYTMQYAKKSEDFESLSKAYFPLSEGFLEASPKIGKLLRDYPGEKRSELVSPLILAVNRQDLGMARFLIQELGFSVSTRDSADRCALVYAINTNNVRLCQLLLNAGFEQTAATAATAAPVCPAESEPGKRKVAGRMKGLFQVQAAGTDESDDADSEDETENNDESLAEEASFVSTSGQQTDAALFSSLEVTSNVLLDQQDCRQQTVFHHLACALQYGSFHNTDICHLLFAAFRYKTAKSTLQPLGDFLKRVDSKLMKAADYALKNGNLALYEELTRATGNQGSTPNGPVITDHLALNKWSANDRFYKPGAAKIEYSADSEEFLKRSLESQGGQHVRQVDTELFRVDPMSNMAKTGFVVWCDKAQSPFDVVLTKTDVSYGLYGMHNFYKLQLISQSVRAEDNAKASNESQNGTSNRSRQFDPSQMCVLFTRWGRIGDQGQCQRTPFATFREARDEFCKLFKQKTANDFTDTVLEKRRPFESKPKRYTLVKLESRRRRKLRDVDFELFDSDSQMQRVFDASMFAKCPDYKAFLGDLLNVGHLKRQITSTQLSAEYIPLTQLSSESIATAGDILEKKLRPAIERRMELEKLNKKENLSEYMGLLERINRLSNDFYDLVPQMGYNYERLAPISTEHELNDQLCTINKLASAQMAVRTLMAARQRMQTVNPFDYLYSMLNVKLELMDASLPEAQFILRYVRPSDEGGAQVKVKRIFKYERQEEVERFERSRLPSGAVKQKNRMLLWHGTATENMISVLAKGLCKAPVEAKHNGARYGRGIYFSDSFEESSSYSRGLQLKDGSGAERGYMLLCEVALGTVKELQNNYETVDTLPAGFDSVKALGRLEPDKAGLVYMPNGAICPLGKPVDASAASRFGRWRMLSHSQYVVYDEAQVLIRPYNLLFLMNK